MRFLLPQTRLNFVIVVRYDSYFTYKKSLGTDGNIQCWTYGEVMPLVDIMSVLLAGAYQHYTSRGTSAVLVHEYWRCLRPPIISPLFPLGKELVHLPPRSEPPGI